MSTKAQTWPTAWEPVTPHGVAAFAGASLKRLLLVQCVVAMLTAGVVVWFLDHAWAPVARAAIQQMPAQGEIRNEQLNWPGDSPIKLAGNHFLGLAVDLNHSGQLGREAHLQVEFGRKNLRVFSLLGYEVIDYPAGWRIAFNRTELWPWFGAWEPAILAGVAALVVLGQMLLWLVLATLYSVPVRIITLFENRDMNWEQSWKLAAAALLPGTLFLMVAIAAYGLGFIDLIRLGGMAGLHLVIGWIYLLISPFFLPRVAAAGAVKANPFAGAKATAGEVPDKKSADKS